MLVNKQTARQDCLIWMCEVSTCKNLCDQRMPDAPKFWIFFYL
uniref:Uncharacterized protein n=1 Tax=Rhizophora mucronata TaxID=61149 RepID=A0A2P2MYS9_RHIMU